MKTSPPVFSAPLLVSLLALLLPLTAGAALPALEPANGLLYITVGDSGVNGCSAWLVFDAHMPPGPPEALPEQMSADYVATIDGVTVASGTFTLTRLFSQAWASASFTYRQAATASGITVTCSNLVNLSRGGGMLYFQGFTKRTLTASGGTVTEGNGGSPVVPFTVSIGKAIDEDLTFSYISSGGTATAGLDYTPVSGMGTIVKGQTSVVINVPVKPDALMEPDETLGLEISDINVPVIRGTDTAGTIDDDDTAPPPGPAPVATSVTETSGSGTRQAWFAVDLPAARTEAVTCNVSTRDGTATAGADYRPMTNATLTFPAGETRRWVAITVTASPSVEATEHFHLDVEESVTHQVKTAACTIERFAVTALTPAPGGAFQVRFPTGLG